MAEAVRGTESVVEQLNERVRELERRVSALESQPEKRTLAPAVKSVPGKTTPVAETWAGFPSPQMPNVVSVLGKAVLGIAGAYLLRAIAESGGVAQVPVLIAAIVYACLWMFWAIRNHTHRFASFTYACTSVLILSPMLWESTVRFRFLPPVVTGVVLVGFFVLTLVETWRRDLHIVPWVAALATVVTALALILATHELVPLTATLLAVALASEIFACFGHHLSLRAVPALAADIAVWLLIFVLTAQTGIPESFHAVSPNAIIALWLILIMIYTGSIGVRCFLLRQQITVIDLIQGGLAFALAVFGALRAPQHLVAPALGAFLLVLAQGCYWGALSRFDQPLGTRNRRTSAAWAAALVIAGSVLVFPIGLQVAFLCVSAVALTFVYASTLKSSLGLHASLFLAAAAAVSPLPGYLVSALSGVEPAAPALSVWIITASAALCYAVGSRRMEVSNKLRALWVFPAGMFGFVGSALAVSAIVWLGSGRLELTASRLSVIRTVVICAVAIAFAFFGFRKKRTELVWVAYATVAFGSLKLLFEDLRYGNTSTLVVSLLFYGSILIILPRLARRERTS